MLGEPLPCSLPAALPFLRSVPTVFAEVSAARRTEAPLQPHLPSAMFCCTCLFSKAQNEKFSPSYATCSHCTEESWKDPGLGVGDGEGGRLWAEHQLRIFPEVWRP